MGQGTPVELIKIKQVVVEIQKFPEKLDSMEQAKIVQKALKKYASLSEKIERNVLVTTLHQKDLVEIRTKKFKALRQSLKEKANSILRTKSNTNGQGEKLAKKAVKKPAPQKTAKAAKETVAKEATAKKAVKKSSPKPKKAATPKEDV